MLAATFWSLLKPALDIALERAKNDSAGSEKLGNVIVILPVAFGFFVGSLFVFMADLLLAKIEGQNAAMSLGKVVCIVLSILYIGRRKGFPFLVTLQVAPFPLFLLDPAIVLKTWLRSLKLSRTSY